MTQSIYQLATEEDQVATATPQTANYYPSGYDYSALPYEAPPPGYG
jgi:hypothetical protein